VGAPRPLISGTASLQTIAYGREWLQDVVMLVACFWKAVNEKNNAFLFGRDRWAVDVVDANIFAITSELCGVLPPWAGQRHFDMMAGRMSRKVRDINGIFNISALAVVS
jgi:hypothetical protein